MLTFKKLLKGIGWIFLGVVTFIVIFFIITQVRVSYYKKIYTKCDGIYGDRDCKWNEQCEFSKYAYPMGECSGEWCVHVPVTECVSLPSDKIFHFWQGDYKRWYHYSFEEKNFKKLCLDRHALIKDDPIDKYGRCKVIENGKVIQETFPNNYYSNL